VSCYLLITFFLFSFFFSINLIDTYVTVPIDVSITPLICLNSFPSKSSFRTSLPPHVHLFCIQIYMHISMHPPALLFEPFVPLCVLLLVSSCGCVSKRVYAFSSSSIFIHTYRHPHMYGLCSVLYLSPPCVFFFVFLQILWTPMSQCLLMYAQPAHMPILFFHMYLHFSNIWTKK